jgi:hypothetical protein
MNYYEKYLKYKNKYLELKSLEGGSQGHGFSKGKGFGRGSRSQGRGLGQGRGSRSQGRGFIQGRGNRSESPLLQKEYDEDKALAYAIRLSTEESENRSESSLWPKEYKGYDEAKALADAIRLTTEESEEYNRILQSHKEFARKRNMRLFQVEGDGNCFYRCVSYALNRSDAMYGNFRQIVLEELKANRDKYVEFIRGVKSDDEDIDKYIERMGTDKEWAGNIELQAFVNSTKVAITLYDMLIGGEVTHVIPDVGTSWKTIQLIYTGNHYNYLE